MTFFTDVENVLQYVYKFSRREAKASSYLIFIVYGQNDGKNPGQAIYHCEPWASGSKSASATDSYCDLGQIA